MIVTPGGLDPHCHIEEPSEDGGTPPSSDGSSMWQWGSRPPGVTIIPLASISSAPRHCHIEEPSEDGGVQEESFSSGSAAALAGGTTSFITIIPLASISSAPRRRFRPTAAIIPSRTPRSASNMIAAVGRNLRRGAEEIDARGMIVTPGGLDPHCHIEPAPRPSRSKNSPPARRRPRTAPRCGSGGRGRRA
jgi:hypothetical protein